MRSIPAWLVCIGNLRLVEVGENEVGEPVEPQVEPRAVFNGLGQGTRGGGSDECGRATRKCVDDVLPHRSSPSYCLAFGRFFRLTTTPASRTGFQPMPEM